MHFYLDSSQIELSTFEIDALRKLQRNLTRSSNYVRVTCILMLSMGNSPSFVSDCLGIDSSGIYRYRNAYLHGGAGELLENLHKGYWGLLGCRRLSALRREPKRHVYTDAGNVSDWICQSFGVRHTVQGTVDLLNHIGFTYKKTTEVSCEAEASGQEGGMQELSSLLKEKDEATVIYYADGVHPTHNSRSTYAWTEKGEELPQPTVSGRERVNVNGLLSAYDVTDVIARDCDSVNAQSTRVLYEAALEKHPEASKIYIISDNAKYYRNKELQEWVKGTKIIHLFLPPYPPNLNLIERV